MPSTENYITQAAGDARYQALGSLGSSTPAQVDAGDAGTAGVSSSAARADHEHPVGITSSQLVPSAWLAAWSTWVPTWSGLTVGNGTVTARYIQMGKTVHYYLKVVFGSTTAVSGATSFTLPVTPRNTAEAIDNPASAQFSDAGTSQTPAWVIYVSGAMFLKYMAAAPNMSNISATAPFTWAVNDAIVVSGTYEAA